ncbi:hypothetical protein ACFYSC_05135 [Streptosporangium sp. NPDC004379]|uniref:hypothetical protein n=1 Tax=Streptosporangium sp. NPDC004379 TaxID=3366189 RepID=UPI00368212F0
MTVIGIVLLAIGFAVGLCLAMADPVLLSRAAAQGREAAGRGKTGKGAGAPPKDGGTPERAAGGAEEADGELIRLPRTGAGGHRARAA